MMRVSFSTIFSNMRVSISPSSSLSSASSLPVSFSMAFMDLSMTVAELRSVLSIFSSGATTSTSTSVWKEAEKDTRMMMTMVTRITPHAASYL